MIYISSFPWKAWLLSILPYVNYLDFYEVTKEKVLLRRLNGHYK